ncbi:HNH endonuclease signature motif containing protein [Microbacterium sp. M3]|uniref:HNH endonuclease signature motif containing protein n=1 Tax=Microbacterium arthrosphaerae TaxID=792652 RepID=A0ABU4GZV1_9MICO|nr:MULTISPECIES: HNH endonuclease signature motif containing protein [Microbacterium]MDW4572613.1 HNH endonuclease signature motif containing protein [Microbacterium arthrosphaerae]MDW7606468.1 HNH endonuclease signature motif containing protein [Microbacterium sp. M3]
MRDKTFAANIRLAIPRLTENHATLRAALSTGQVHASQPSHYAVEPLTDTQLRSLYDQQLAHPSGAARPIYDELLAGARYNLCTYCQHAQATTLDHFLPKSWVAGLAIEPWNLVPACQQCNKKLSSFHAAGESDTLFHPYEEQVTERWLFAELVEGEPPVLRFVANPPESLDALSRDRVCSQFATLGLAFMFSAISGRDIAEARLSVAQSVRVAREMGSAAEVVVSPTSVSESLLETSRMAFAVDVNSRRGAAYEALGMSVSFCNELAHAAEGRGG